MNIPLFSAIFSIAFTVAAGVLMIIAFVLGYDSAMHIIGSVVVGLLISVPALVVTKRLSAINNGRANQQAILSNKHS